MMDTDSLFSLFNVTVIVFFFFRKAIAKAGVQDNAAQSGAIIPGKCEPNKEICSTVDWTVSYSFVFQQTS